MHRCQQSLFPFSKHSKKSGLYRPSGLVAEAAIACYTQLDITGQKVFKKQVPLCQRLVYVSYNHTRFAFKVPCCCYRAGVRAAAAQIKHHAVLGTILWGCPCCLSCARRASRRFLFSEAYSAYRGWDACRAGVRWVPSQYHAAAGMWHLRCPARWDASSSILSMALFFNTACPRWY